MWSPALKASLISIAAAILLSVLACGGQSAEGPSSRQLVITGSSTVAPLISDIAQRFEAENPGVRIDIQTGGSSRGLSDVRQGLADIGMVSRSPKAGEDDVQWFPVAKDGLAIIVHAENELDGLEEAQVKSIYRGDLTDWAELGGSAAPITVVSKAEGRSTLEVFLEHFDLNSPEVRASVVIGDNQQGLKTVVGNPDAIGYVSIGAAELEAKLGAPVKLLRLGEAVPSTDAVRADEYPISRTLHLVSAATPEGLAATFLAYCRSSAVADLVEGQYFVPLAG
ncbi:MAG: phosphate ABC transporter substrate-binding protein [Acidobacteriota bacterium]